MRARRGKKRAVVAIGRTLLELVHSMLSHGTLYDEPGPDYYQKQHAQRLTKYHVKSLQELGHTVVLQPAA